MYASDWTIYKGYLETRVNNRTFIILKYFNLDGEHTYLFKEQDDNGDPDKNIYRNDSLAVLINAADEYIYNLFVK